MKSESVDVLMRAGFSKAAATALIEDGLLREMVEAAVAVTLVRRRGGRKPRQAKPLAKRKE